MSLVSVASSPSSPTVTVQRHDFVSSIAGDEPIVAVNVTEFWLSVVPKVKYVAAPVQLNALDPEMSKIIIKSSFNIPNLQLLNN